MARGRGGMMPFALKIIKALSDQQRLRILMLLNGGELCVCQIVEVLELAPSTISKHLFLLENADLITGRKSGRWMYYRLKTKHTKPLSPLLKWLQAVLADDSQILKDRHTLKKVTSCDPVMLRKRQRNNEK